MTLIEFSKKTLKHFFAGEEEIYDLNVYDLIIELVECLEKHEPNNDIRWFIATMFLGIIEKYEEKLRREQSEGK